MNNNLNRKRKTRNSIFWGIVLVGAAVFLILNGIGVDLGYGISVWRIVLGALCLGWLIERLIARSFSETIFPLAFLFLIFEKPIAHAIGRPDDNLISDWTVILAALLLTIGLKAILPEKSGGRSFDKLGASTLYFDAADLSNANIYDCMGTVNAYVTNVDAYPGGGTIRIYDNMATVKVHLPRRWAVITNCHDNMGRVSIPDQSPDRVYDKSITLEISDNMGNIEVTFD